MSLPTGFNVIKNISHPPTIMYELMFQNKLIGNKLIGNKLIGNKLIGNIQCCISIDNVYKNRHVTRNSVKEEADVIRIIWLEIDSNFRGQGLGTLLINYALSDLKILNPSINYAVVDDDTDGADSLKNIYSGVGFKYQSMIALMGSKKIGQKRDQGPERQLRLGIIT